MGGLKYLDTSCDFAAVFALLSLTKKTRQCANVQPVHDTRQGVLALPSEAFINFRVRQVMSRNRPLGH